LVEQRAASWEQARAAAESAARLEQLQALRWAGRTAAEPAPPPVEELAHFLQDSSIEVRLYVMRWIADERIGKLHGQLVEGLKGLPHVTPELFFTWAAAIEILDRGVPITAPNEPNPYLVQAVLDPKTAPDLRTLALRFSPPDHKKLTLPLLTEFTRSDNGPFRREAVRTLALRAAGDGQPLLASLAADGSADPELRADAVAGLTSHAADHRTLLEKLATGDAPAVRVAAERALRWAKPVPPSTDLPDPKDLDAWLKLTEKPGDAAAGWRVFFTGGALRCAACHRFDGRGNTVGPDLTGIGRRLDRRRILESILQPSREIAPQYVAWKMVTDDGRVLLGLSRGFNDAGTHEIFLGNDGKSFDLDVRRIAERSMSVVSLMPDGLQKVLTVDELRDVLALLKSAD
ncbi:MAG TPA: hypothetical protein VFE24_10350, partial [Pirellulales bacterium]|nr:hypothetical protein [Pirellulales bacterium]